MRQILRFLRFWGTILFCNTLLVLLVSMSDIHTSVGSEAYLILHAVARQLQTLNVAQSPNSYRHPSEIYPEHQMAFARMSEPNTEANKDYKAFQQTQALDLMNRFGGAIGENSRGDGFAGSWMGPQPSSGPLYSHQLPAIGSRAEYPARNGHPNSLPRATTSAAPIHSQAQNLRPSVHSPSPSLHRYVGGPASNVTYRHTQAIPATSTPLAQAHPASNDPYSVDSRTSHLAPPLPTPQDSQTYLAHFTHQLEARRQAEIEEDRRRRIDMENQRSRNDRNLELDNRPGQIPTIPQVQREVSDSQQSSHQNHVLQPHRRVLQTEAMLSVSPQKRHNDTPPVEDNFKRTKTSPGRIMLKIPNPQKGKAPMHSTQVASSPGSWVERGMLETPPPQSKLSRYRSPGALSENGEDDGDEDMELSPTTSSQAAKPFNDSGIDILTPTSKSAFGTPMRRTGMTPKSARKDHYKYLANLFEDIFEAEDTLPAVFNSNDLTATSHFDRMSEKQRQDGRALLSRLTIKKLAAMFSLCTNRSRPSKTLIGAKQSATSVPESLAEWDSQEISRICKLLERSMAEAEGVIIFPNNDVTARAVASPDKTEAKGKKRNKQATEADGVHTPLDVGKAINTVHQLNSLADAVLAGECLLTLLTADDLAKPLYSEEAIRLALEGANTAVCVVLIPLLEGLATTQAITSSVLHHTVTRTDDMAKAIRTSISSVASATIKFLHRLPRLISHGNFRMPDPLVYRITHLTVSLIFTLDPFVESKTGALARSTIIWKEAMNGQLGTKALKLEATEVIKRTYATQGPSEREDILKEVLGSIAQVADLKKSQSAYRTRNGKSIHFISALLLELIQTGTQAINTSLVTPDVGDDTLGPEQGSGTRLKNHVNVFVTAIEDMERSATYILKFMMNKITLLNGGKTKSSLESNYRALLETFLDDQVEVLYMPEYPVAAISLGITARNLMPVLDDPKPQAESAIIRGIAIDHLGSLASKLRWFEITFNNSESATNLREMIISANVDCWEAVAKANQAFLGILRSNASQNGLYTSAADIATAQWLVELDRVSRWMRDKLPDTSESEQQARLMSSIEADFVRTGCRKDDDSVFIDR